MKVASPAVYEIQRRRPAADGNQRQCLRASGVHIPHDLIVLILVSVPAKSLMRFKMVSRLWLSTISDPKFIELHRRLSRDRIGGSYFASLKLPAEKVTVKFTGKCDVPRPIQLNLEDLFPSFPIRKSRYAISASPILNGLVCLQCGHRAVILNLTTREIFHLPETTFGGGNFTYSRYTLGYDPTTEKYKVVHCGKRNFFQDPIAEVYTLGTNSWRCFVDPAEIITKSSHISACLNGKIYWLAELHGIRDQRYLISFDVGTENFHTIKFSLPINDLSNLFSIGENLAAVGFHFCGSRKVGIELWKFEERNTNDELVVVASKNMSFPYGVPKMLREILVLEINSDREEIVFGDHRTVKRVHFTNIDYYGGPWTVKHYFTSFSGGSGQKICHFENMFRLSDP